MSDLLTEKIKEKEAELKRYLEQRERRTQAAAAPPPETPPATPPETTAQSPGSDAAAGAVGAPSPEDIERLVAERTAELRKELDRVRGQYGSTLDKLRRELEETKAELARKSAPPPPPPPAAAPPRPKRKLVSDDLREAFPNDADAIEETVARLEDELRELKQLSAGAARDAAEATRRVIAEKEHGFYARLSAAAPDYVAVVNDPEFVEFCEKTPDGYRRTLAQNLAEAAQDYDPEPLIAAIKKWQDARVPPREPPMRAAATPKPAASTPRQPAAQPEQDEATRRKKRIAELENKQRSQGGNLNPEELAELSRLYDREMEYRLNLHKGAMPGKE